jgi:hypothetical protein
MSFEFRKSSSIYETFSPLYKVLKLLGIIPFEMNSRGGEVGVKFPQLLWMSFTWMFWTGLIVSNVLLGAREPGEMSKLLLTGWHWVLIFQIIACFYVQLINLMNRKSIGKLLKILHEVDEMVRF